jgi:glycerol-3-phosphate dehydrogenase (NAD(P)+)
MPERDDAPVVEGVATAPALIARAAQTELPICAGVAALLARKIGLKEAMAGILARRLRDE